MKFLKTTVEKIVQFDYGDDVVLFTESKELQHIIEKISASIGKFNMNTNLQKTKRMVVRVK